MFHDLDKIDCFLKNMLLQLVQYKVDSLINPITIEKINNLNVSTKKCID